MNKIQFDKLLKPLIDIYDEIELDLIRKVIERLTTYKSIQGSLEWYLEKIADLGTLDRDNLKIIKNNKKKIEKVLKEIAAKSGTHIEDLEILQGYFDKGLINVNPKDLFKSVSINNLIDEALKDTENIMRLIDTKAIESTKEAYMKILNKAYIETASGIKTYTESIREGIKEFAREGIKGATYESGKTISIEAVVRRDVITRMNKLIGDSELEHAKDLETNLVYVDQHLGARVRTKYMKHDYEAHAEWQGKKYMLEGSSEEYPNFYEATGYGEMLGLKGINCGHDFRPTWEWEKVDPILDEIKNAEVYKLHQKQRAFERKIRKLKREKVASKDIDSEEYDKVSHKLKKVNAEFDKWLKDNKLTRDYNREYVSNLKDKTVSCTNQDFVIGSDGKKYIVDNKNIILDHTENEINIATWYAENNKVNVKMLPRVLNPPSIKTGDFIEETSKVIWEIKEPEGNTLGTTMVNQFKGQKEKAQHFIIDLHKTDMTSENAIEDIEKILSNKRYEWVKRVILKNNDVLIKEFTK